MSATLVGRLTPRTAAQRKGLKLALAMLGAIAVLYIALPSIAGFDDTWRRLSRGDPLWLVLALLLEVLSFASYMIVFRLVFATGNDRIGWRLSYQITMAGVVATRLIAVAGAGGIALTVWALRRVGLGAKEVAAQMATFYVLVYGIYMLALVVFGLGLSAGVLSGPAPAGLTLLPALFGLSVIVVALTTAWVLPDLDHTIERSIEADRGRLRRWLAVLPATLSSGVRGAAGLLATRRAGLLGAVGWWAFDVAVLWACLHAFGSTPPVAVIVTAYFVGMAANFLPLPGGVGAVDGGMIAALVGFGVAAGPAIVGVLSYRALAFWLPIIPGAIAYTQLLRMPQEQQA